jgi:Flp pilus assembly protein TadG
MARFAPRTVRRLSGAVTAEMAMVSPFLTLMFFGVVELGAVCRDYGRLASAANAGAQVAARGGTIAEITTAARAAAGGLKPSSVNVMAGYRTYRPGTGYWSEWSALRNAGNGAGNTSPARCQIRVIVTYPHTLVMPTFFSVFATEPDGETVMLRPQAIATRQ